MAVRLKLVTYALVLIVAALPFRAYSDNGKPPISITDVSRSFSPIRNEAAEIHLSTTSAGTIELEVIEPDDNVVTRLVSEVTESGTHTLIWNGRDDNQQIVPDEAFRFRANLLGKDGQIIGTDDPALETGGELLANVRPTLGENSVGFSLSHSSRVLVRLGLKEGGPMMRNLLRWEPRAAGKNRVAWDGLDGSGVVDLRADPKLTAMVMAYKLPEKSTITHGNTKINYRQWFEENNFLTKEVPANQQQLARGSERIAREFYRSVHNDREPKLTLEIIEAGKALEPPYQLSQPSVLRVNADKDSEWLLDESLYEVGFFVDGVFVAEEEQGYLPMSWRLDPKRYGSGRHTLTVNISGFDGRVGVGSMIFHVGSD